MGEQDQPRRAPVEPGNPFGTGGPDQVQQTRI
jgi:hypothetical protein